MAKTMFIITYDEHGGYFDPLPPPPAVVPDVLSYTSPAFASLGVRVPTVIVSPLTPKGLDETVYDHTSILKYVLLKWAPQAVGFLGKRVLEANPIKVHYQQRDLAEFPEGLHPSPDLEAEAQVPQKILPVSSTTDPIFQEAIHQRASVLMKKKAPVRATMNKVMASPLPSVRSIHSTAPRPQCTDAKKKESKEVWAIRHEAELSATVDNARKAQGSNITSLHSSLLDLMDHQAPVFPDNLPKKLYGQGGLYRV